MVTFFGLFVARQVDQHMSESAGVVGCTRLEHVTFTVLHSVEHE